MSASTSVAVVFRTLQAIHDLRALVRGASDASLARISAGLSVPDADNRLRYLVFKEGCRLSGSDAPRLHVALSLAATLPNDDHDAFMLATAILLADRLQHGDGTDDLYWHWDAFHAHYRLCPPPARAAIMNGFRRAQDERLVLLDDPPDGMDLVSRPYADVVAGLAGTPSSMLLRRLRAALERGERQGTEDLWKTQAAELCALGRPATHVIRYLYESDHAWRPFGDRRHPVDDPQAPIIPFSQD